MNDNIHFVITGKTSENYFFSVKAGNVRDCIIQLSQEPCLENYEFTDVENWQDLNRVLKDQDVDLIISTQIIFDDKDPYTVQIFDMLY